MDKATSAAFDRLTSPFDDPQLKKELSGMAKAAEAYEKQFAALKPQIDQMSEASSAPKARENYGGRRTSAAFDLLSGSPVRGRPQLEKGTFQFYGEGGRSLIAEAVRTKTLKSRIGQHGEKLVLAHQLAVTMEEAFCALAEL